MNAPDETMERVGQLGSDDPTGTVSLLGLCNAVLRHRGVLGLVALLSLSIGLAVVLLSGRGYTVESTFTPEASDDAGSRQTDILQRIAPGLGLREGGKLDFYTEVLQSRELLKRAVTAEYEVPASEGSDAVRRVDLLTVYGIDPGDQRDRIQAAIDELSRNVSTSTDAGAGLVRLRVYARSPDLGVQVNRMLLTLLNEFNVERRQSSASAERAFVEERVEEARAELLSAEERLELFYQENRRFRGSPELSFAAARLEREISVLQEVYVALARSLEQIKIQEVRATPLITIVDPPEWALPESAPSVWVQLFLWLFFGAMLGIILALTVDMIARQRHLNPDDYREFRQHIAELRRRLPRFWTRRTGQSVSPAQSKRDQLPVGAELPAEDGVEVGR